MSARSAHFFAIEGWVCRAKFSLVVFLLASTAVATIWTRSASVVSIRPGEILPLKNVAYGTRDWTVSVETVEAQPMPAPSPGLVSVTWAFGFINTDTQPHYVSIRIQYLDGQRHSRASFSHTFKIDPGQKDSDRRGFEARCTQNQWRGFSQARITVDFLSTPEG